MADEENYKELFKGELSQLDDQYAKTNDLYDKTYKALDKNVQRMEEKTVFGGTSPYRDISELSKSLGSISQTTLAITREKINTKKTIAELELKAKRNVSDAKTADTNEFLMRDMLIKLGSKNNLTRPDKSELSTKGIENLNNMNPNELGINENDLKGIERFKKASGSNGDK